ncbi:MAG: type II toxin-antitoxin system VapC family toxin [Spongiibacteraceae bacterium]|nr:type II toxin-antitoxin system VapC family toxin [Spongiibacteraceae bacterium]
MFNDDEHWYEWSANTLYEASKKYKLTINTIVFTEIAFNFDSSQVLQTTLHQLNISVVDIPLDAAFKTSRVFKKYRKNGGDKKTAMPDFYIGAQAWHQQGILITRDVSRYKSYFPQLKLITP